jgi:hypothetical protein
MSDALAGPYAATAVVLLAAGVAKVVEPDDTARALVAAGLRVRGGAVRAGAVLEALLGLLALSWESPAVAAAVAGSYLAFAGFVLLAVVRRTPVASCGCFGEPDTPPTIVHVVLNLTAAVVALGVYGRGGVDVFDVVAGQPLGGVPFVGLVGVTSALAFLALARLPRLQAVSPGRRR